MLIRIWCTTAAVVVVAGCKSDRPTAPRATEVVQDSRGPLNPALIASGQATFRSDTYGNLNDPATTVALLKLGAVLGVF
jgi:hypothetical protein